MTTPSLEDRACGALLGLAIGDALGAPLVGLGREQAQIKHGTVSTFLGGGLYLLGPGETTARIDMARAAAVALLGDPPTEPPVDPVLEAYLQVLDGSRPGLGEMTRASLENIREGREPKEASREAHEALGRQSAGIGPALRALPYALLIADEHRYVDAVLADASLTHVDRRAGAAAVALGLQVRAHLWGDEDGASALASVREKLGERPELPEVLPAPAAVMSFRVRPTAFAPDVLHVVARHTTQARSAKQAITGAVNEAGAAAALGAATGAVVGARFGASGLPDAWTGLVQGAPAWRKLARRLLDAGGREG